MIRGRYAIFQYFFYAFILIMVLALFYRFTVQNNERIQEQNLVYAEDAARQTAMRIDDTLTNSLDLIRQYAKFLSFSLKEPVISPTVLQEIEQNSPFNTIRFSDENGINFSGTGVINSAIGKEYFIEGMQGKSGVAAVLNSESYGQTVLGFFSPVYFNGKIIGVLRGNYLADSYLRELQRTNFFGKPAQVFLCMPDGNIIANSSSINYSGNIEKLLISQGDIENKQRMRFEEAFKNTDTGLLLNAAKGISNNICIVRLPSFNYFLIQVFPADITAAMVRNANLTGIQLELSLLLLSALLAIFLLVRAKMQKKVLEKENRFFSTVIKGMSTVFKPHYIIADLGTDEYTEFSGTPHDSTLARPRTGQYTQLVEKYGSFLKSKEGRREYLKFFQPDTLINMLTRADFTIFECLFERKGQQSWENIIGVCLERKDGLPSKVLFLRQDITDVRKRELQTSKKLSILNRRERQYQLALTSTAISNYEFNVSRDLLDEDVKEYRNHKQVSILKSKNLSVPCKISDWFSAWGEDILPESREDYDRVTSLRFLMNCLEAGQQDVEIDYWRIGDNGEEQCIRQNFYLTRDALTNDVMALTVSHDITAQVLNQRRQTRALQDALMQARHASEAKTTFLSNMSHDIRTPMNAIIGFATIAANHIDNREQVEDCLQKVLASSNHLLCLINDILDMSRIESGKLQMRIQECNISDIMHNLVNIIQAQLKAKQLRFFVETNNVINEDMMADPLKLNQVLINLLGNAVKYTPAGGTIHFSISQKQASRPGYADYIFVVQDNGIGMSQDFVKHIFEPFERESTTTKTGIQGTGLGMAITKNIIDIMNGSIEVESSPGMGSTFTVTLTLQIQDKREDKDAIETLKDLRVLVIDDDEATCISVTKMLEKLGLRADWTKSGADAVFKIRQAHEKNDPYKTFIIDWQMPEQNGLDTSKKIRDIVGKDLPIIILTAYDWTDIEEESREAQINDFCPKPLFMSDLKRALLNSHHLLQKSEEEITEHQDFKGSRILLVDDLEMNREMAEFILTESGFQVETAPDGTDAVEMLRKSPEKYYDAILMDVQMPTMDGYEATRTIRNLPRADVENMPIIAMTANALEDDREAALKSGMNAHISKPIDIEKFFEVLQKYIHSDKHGQARM